MLSESFCYALQASFECDDLFMRIDTEKTIVKKIGKAIRGQDSQYNSNCLNGLSQVDIDLENGLCEKAWRNFGCNGKKIPGLLQKSDSLCKFKFPVDKKPF